MYQFCFYNVHTSEMVIPEYKFETFFGACYYASVNAAWSKHSNDVINSETGEVLATFDEQGELIYVACDLL